MELQVNSTVKDFVALSNETFSFSGFESSHGTAQEVIKILENSVGANILAKL